MTNPIDTPKKKGRGRRKIPRSLRRSEWIGAAVTVDEKTRVEAMASEAGMEISALIRDRLGLGKSTTVRKDDAA